MHKVAPKNIDLYKLVFDLITIIDKKLMSLHHFVEIIYLTIGYYKLHNKVCLPRKYSVGLSREVADSRTARDTTISF